MFIYVMDVESRDLLINKGYQLLKADEQNGVWCFVNDTENLTFEENCPCVISDIMTF